MVIALESNYLVPNATFMVELLVVALVFVFLVLWPLIGAVREAQWGWLVAIVLFGPVAGALWFALRPRASRDPLDA